MAPNSAAIFRALWLGEIEVITAPIQHVKRGLTELGKAPSSMSTLVQAFNSLTADEVNKMRGDFKLPVYAGVLAKEQVLYLPPAWLIAERCSVASGPLHYGIRKSVFVKSKDLVTNYAMAKELLSVDGSVVTKMEEVLELLQD